MAQSDVLWGLLREAAHPDAVAALQAHVATAPDHKLVRVNPLAFAAERNLREEDAIAAFVHAARIGVFDLHWNLLCPGCGGVMESGAALKSLRREQFVCALCAADYVATLDELVEATFTVNARVRRVAGHQPDTLPHAEYMRQAFWSSGLDLPENIEATVEGVVLDALELGPGEKATLSLNLPAEFSILFDPVTHTAIFLDVKGEPTTERRNLSFVLSDHHSAYASLELQPGPARLALENRSGRRTLPGVWVHNENMDRLFKARRPFLTASRLMSNQTFRDVYRNATLDPEQRFKITNLTILFTDLRGSTELYDRVGDLAAFDLVRHHFNALLGVVGAEGGAVVKTIGDAVMATFPTADRGVRAAFGMREAMRALNRGRAGDDIALNIGLHEGPCLAVTLDDRADFFGQTVNIASRVQRQANPDAVLATKPIVANADVAAGIDAGHYVSESRRVTLRGVSEAFDVFEMRERP